MNQPILGTNIDAYISSMILYWLHINHLTLLWWNNYASNVMHNKRRIYMYSTYYGKFPEINQWKIRNISSFFIDLFLEILSTLANGQIFEIRTDE